MEGSELISYQGSTLSLFTNGVQGEVDTDAETRLKKSTRSTRGNSTKYIQPQSNSIAHTKTFRPTMEPVAQLSFDVLAKSARDIPSSRTSYSHQRTCATDVLLCIRTQQIRNSNQSVSNNTFVKCVKPISLLVNQIIVHRELIKG